MPKITIQAVKHNKTKQNLIGGIQFDGFKSQMVKLIESQSKAGTNKQTAISLLCFFML